MSDVQLDRWQSAALEACRAPCRVSVLGAPGTGKSAVVAALVAREAALGRRIAVLTLDRRAASSLQSAVSLTNGSLSERVSVRSLVSFCYGIVQSYAQAVGRREPELISGPEEDALLSDILADPETGVEFPDFVDDGLRRQRGFRAQMRDLLTRACELGLSPRRLEALGRERGEPMWVAGGQLLGLYEGVTTARDALAGAADAPDRLDHAHLVGAATAILRDWEANVPGPHPRPRWDWAIVEDIHNAPRSVLGLLAELAADGASVVTTGDPDCAVQGFRGGVASLPGDVAAPAPRGLGSRTVALRQRHRGGPKIAGVADALAEAVRVGGGAIRQRNPRAAERRDSVSARRFVHPEEEAAAIARAVREARLLRGIPYSEMAVVTRSRSTHPGLRASLVRRGVPVGQTGTDRPLREEPAVDALVALVRLALEGASGNAELVRVLTGPLVGIDPLRLRQIGRILRGGELARGGSRSESQLLSLAAEGPSRLSEVAPRGIGDLLRAARMLETVRETAERSNRQAEEVLWAAWESSGKAEEWREAALRGGTAGDAADSALDSVIQLFRVAQRMADRDVDVPVDVVLDELQTHNLPEDSIARAGAAAQTVTLTTPNASIGRQWEFVVVAGLQDGLWPNMRLRDTYTATGRLAQIVTGRDPGASGADGLAGRRQAYEEILDDELRQLHHAVTRADGELLLTCVDSEEARPSRFFELMGFVPEELRDAASAGRQGSGDARQSDGPPDFGGARRSSSAPDSDGVRDAAPASGRLVLESPRAAEGELDVVGLVADIRRSGADGPEAEDVLARLREAGFRQADRSTWAEALEPTPSRGVEEGKAVVVSPSRVETMLDCPLRGFLSLVGAEDSDDRRTADIGTLVHAIAERSANSSREEIMGDFEASWAAFDKPEDPVAAQAEYARARLLVEGLASYLEDFARGGGSAEVERRISVDVEDGVVLSGKIDRVEHDGAARRIVDFKTGKRAVSAKQAEDNVQLQLYQWAMGESGLPADGGAALVYLGQTLKKTNLPAQREQRPLGPEGRALAEERLRQAGRLLRGGEFPARPSEACRTCRFLSLCPAKSQGRLAS